ncbi:MAG: nicotinate-nucleotide adenylyltransferase [Thermoguttaceae bacterium]|nr:nicotinate-nucleotide adenylyltransferase [Thermoguttaceae bacterium]MDO4858847.1 nicotinate-nucleotide adenylyltransferase [Thermoguttaceae bacterium]
MRLGIYGGTFDPIHFGHLLLAETARETLGLDRVLFVPAKIPPHKQGKYLTSEEHRVAMIRLALRGNPAFKLELFELRQNAVSYTVYTLEYLRRKYPNDELFLLMGEDMLRIFPDWYEPKRICELATLALIGRSGQEIGNLSFLKGLATRERLRQIRASRVPMPAVAFSSTEIRERVKAGKSVKFWLPDSVRKYIEKNNLY